MLNKFYIPWKHWLSTKWVMIVFKTKIYLKSHISYSLGAGVEWHGLEDGSQQTEPVSPAPCPPRPPCLPVLVQPQTREKLGIWLADHLLTSLRRTDRRVPPLPTTVASLRNMIPLMKMCHNLVIVTKDPKVKIFNRIRHENIHHYQMRNNVNLNIIDHHNHLSIWCLMLVDVCILWWYWSGPLAV